MLLNYRHQSQTLCIGASPQPHRGEGLGDPQGSELQNSSFEADALPLHFADSPTREVVDQYATHLLAEMEQVPHIEKKSVNNEINNVKPENPKIRKFEEDGKGAGKGQQKFLENKKETDEKSKPSCRFFMSVMDVRRQSLAHGSVSLTRSRAPRGDAGHVDLQGVSLLRVLPVRHLHRGLQLRMVDHLKGCQRRLEPSWRSRETQEFRGHREQMKTLIEEASRMLKKSLNRRAEPQRLCRLQWRTGGSRAF